MSVKIDLSLKTFGELTVMSEHHSDGKHLYWNCICKCGNTTIVSGDSLKRGVTTSCGCVNKKLAKDRFTKHGKSKTRLYHIWTGMIYRCTNPKATGFENWGGKGVNVCREWKDDFMNFFLWAMKSGYSDNLEIDRIDNDGNYEPGNCQWITKSENIKKMWSDKKLREKGR